ncbi:hypothetical protein [Halobaculum sp. MBLA0143]|uniref:hypothetical protein n=1 Tax=Halobaculum sp. MBLA0143 TaxID=3079933 RepID=UPI003523B89B
MDLDSTKEDTLVAASAAGTAVAVTVVTELLLNLDAALWLRVLPLAVYLVYLFSRKGGPYGSLDTPRTWSAAAVVTGVLAVGVAVV